MPEGVEPSAAGRRRLGAVCGAGVLAVLLLGVWLHGATVPTLDTRLHDAVMRHRGGDLLVLARGVTEGGSTKLVWPLLVIGALTFPRARGPRSWAGAVAVGGLAGLAVGVRLLISVAVHRQRPPEADWAMHAGGYAFPSGHTTAATVAAGFLAWALTRHLADRRGRTAVWTLAVAYAGMVGWSRVWLGVHWPLDVLGGWLLGSAWLGGMAVLVALVSRAHPGWIDD